MARYIDADMLIDKIKAKATDMFTVDSVYEYYIDALIDVEDIIKSEPTADVRENVKGEWIFNPSDAIEMMFTKPKCSECGFESADGGNFCSNCGADMRGNNDL